VGILYPKNAENAQIADSSPTDASLLGQKDAATIKAGDEAILAIDR
jgi:hypothetical protein